MADDAPAVKDDAATQDAAQTAPATVETKAPEGDPILETLKQDEEKPVETDKPAEPSEEQPKEEEAKTEETPEAPKGKAEDRKSQLNTEIRDLVSKRNQLKSEVEQLNSQAYQVASEEELVDQGYTETDARVEALRQQYEMDKYNTQVADAQLTLANEAQRVEQDFPMFNADSPEYKPELAAQADRILGQSLIIDPNTGQPIGSNVSPYELYKTLAQTYQASSQEGQVKGQQATEKMMANADHTGSASPPRQQKDPILEILKSDDY